MLGEKVNDGYRLTCQLTIQQMILKFLKKILNIEAPKKQSAIQTLKCLCLYVYVVYKVQ